MDNHVNPMDGMRPDGDYTAAQLGKLLRLLNANYHLRGGDINTHLVLGGIRFSNPPTLDTCNKWLTDSGPVAEAAMMPGGGPIWPIGYQKAITAIVEGRYRVCDDDPNVFYALDRPDDGMEALESYHVLNFESELDMKSASRSREIERALKAMIRLMATLRPDLYAPVRRGARIHTPSGRQATMYVKDGTPTLTNKNEPDHIPYIVDIAVPEEALPGNKDDYQAMNARVHTWMSFVTGTEASALNLALYWAYPIMAPRLENLWCFYGQGGNGKGLLFGGFRRTFDRWCSEVDIERLSQGGFDGGNEAGKLVDALWVSDPESDMSSEACARAMKKIATCDPFTVRYGGGIAYEVRPHCGFISLTNRAPYKEATRAFERRLVEVNASEGHTHDEFAKLADWLDNRYGAVEMLLFSANLWAHGYRPDMTESIGTLESLDEAELFAIKEIVEKGFTVSADNPYLGKGRRYSRSFINRTGLKTGRRQGDFGLMVKSESMFKPYREAMESMLTADVRQAEALKEKKAMRAVTDLAILTPNDADPVEWARAKRDGGDTGVYVPAENKVARNWHRKAESGQAATLPDFTVSPSAAEIAGDNTVIIDWDADHDGNGCEHGLNRMERDLGALIGSEDFPMPYLERSARGGYHGTYRVPPDLMRYFKKSAVGRSTSGDPTLLVDLKAAGGGYVICAGSRTDQGVYEPVTAPSDGRVPMLTQPMLELFSEYGFVRLPEAYVGPDGKAHVGHGDSRPTVAPSAYARFKSSDGRLHLDTSPMAPHMRHNELLRRAVYVAAAAKAMKLPQSDIDSAFDELRSLAGDHDRKDTEHVLEDVARNYGFQYRRPRTDDPND
ncbi:DUF5906 domain-containing protein [Bifidobacterium thermophilum]|uniref:NrS-1 polymerase-like helicase domain-containing protein n=1 Tax=Bifidobacterium thermophilum TaxID=33905 RepID=A0A7X9NR72_9BIFI|nr:DUF5906 domain-containing protein [Bifidobacterium thermophilum]NME62301.1 hypothetical protein [Bifidobacterium thermophilum]